MVPQRWPLVVFVLLLPACSLINDFGKFSFGGGDAVGGDLSSPPIDPGDLATSDDLLSRGDFAPSDDLPLSRDLAPTSDLASGDLRMTTDLSSPDLAMTPPDLGLPAPGQGCISACANSNTCLHFYGGNTTADSFCTFGCSSDSSCSELPGGGCYKGTCFMRCGAAFPNCRSDFICCPANSGGTYCVPPTTPGTIQCPSLP